MSAEIINFPPIKELVQKEVVTKKSGIKFRKKKYTLCGVEVDPPNNRFDYLDLCKRFLPEDKYRDVLCGICDKEIYNTIRPTLQKLVDNYYMLDVK
jgi:hypothetical protein